LVFLALQAVFCPSKDAESQKRAFRALGDIWEKVMLGLNLQLFGGRSGSSRSGGSNTLRSLGLKVEQEVDEDLFDFFDIRYGSYAHRLAQEANEVVDDDSMLVVSFTKGNNKAYAVIDTEADSLDGIMSTGGGTGTELLGKVMEYQQGQGKGLMWYAENPESVKYYDKVLGLKEFGKGSSKSKMYEISPDDMRKAIKKVKK